eukprot:8630057-Alexandrium_andersonii.AAC.1
MSCCPVLSCPALPCAVCPVLAWLGQACHAGRAKHHASGTRTQRIAAHYCSIMCLLTCVLAIACL